MQAESRDTAHNGGNDAVFCAKDLSTAKNQVIRRFDISCMPNTSTYLFSHAPLVHYPCAIPPPCTAGAKAKPKGG
jgi:hypothetical protein